MIEKILAIVNQIRANTGLAPLVDLSENSDLRSDLDLDSFGLAELTIHIEEIYGVDVFADGLVRTVGEIMGKLPGDR